MRRLLVLVALLPGATALAEPAATTQAKAAALFEKGRQQIKRGETEAACGSFAESFALVAAEGTELNLADCHERLGHLADAWRLFEQTATLSASKGNTARAQTARDRAAKLLSKLGTVIVDLAEPAANGLAVTIAGASVDPSAEIQRKVDPGAIAIHASQPERAAFDHTVTVEAGTTATVKIPALGPPSATSVGTAQVGSAQVGSAQIGSAQTGSASDTPTPGAGPRRTRVIVGIAVGAAGVLALATSGVLALSAHSEYQDQFDSGACIHVGGHATCTTDGAHHVDHATSRANLATGVGAVALAATIAGAVLWYTAPKDVAVVPTVSTTAAGAAVTGQF